jgi:hypothetical protein
MGNYLSLLNLTGIGLTSLGISYYVLAKGLERAKKQLVKQGSPMHVSEAMVDLGTNHSSDEYRMVVGVLKCKDPQL